MITIGDYVRQWVGSVYSVYSDKLSQKFWDLVRADFPKIDLDWEVVKKGQFSWACGLS